MNKKISRRGFVFNTIKLLGVAFSLSISGRFFSLLGKTNNNLSLNKQGAKSNRKDYILIAYESKFGTTKDVAKFISNKLPSNKNIDVLKIGDIEDITQYSHVIIGSAIQYDNWMPDARDFVVKHKDYLQNIPVAYFFTCLVLSKKTEKAKKKAIGYSDKLKNISKEVNPISIGQFAGVLDYSKMSFTTRTIAKGVMAIMKVKEGDYRDWTSIESWVKSIEI